MEQRCDVLYRYYLHPIGDIDNFIADKDGTGGQIVTTGSSTTNIFNDLAHDGVEIRTSAGNTTVIGGSVRVQVLIPVTAPSILKVICGPVTAREQLFSAATWF